MSDLRRGRSGSILMIALWALFTLAGFAVILGYQVRQKMVLVKRLEARNKLTMIAEAAIPLGIAEIRKFEKAQVFALKDNWSVNPQWKNIKVADGTCSFVRPLPDPPAFGEVSAYGMSDEESKVNINKADMRLLTSLMRVVLGADDSEAQGLAASIIDWRDADSEMSVPIGSAEDPQYRSAGAPYECKDSLFQSIDELLLVNGFNSNIFDKLKNYITIYGSGRININTASREILYSAGFNPVVTGKILDVRAGKDGAAGTADDVVFDSIPDIVPKLTQAGGFSVSDITAVSAVVENCVGTMSTAFTISSVGQSVGFKDSATVNCVIDVKGRVLSYRRQ